MKDQETIDFKIKHDLEVSNDGLLACFSNLTYNEQPVFIKAYASEISMSDWSEIIWISPNLIPSMQYDDDFGISKDTFNMLYLMSKMHSRMMVEFVNIFDHMIDREHIDDLTKRIESLEYEVRGA